MYGWILAAFELYVTTKYSPKVWTTAKGAIALTITEEEDEENDDQGENNNSEGDDHHSSFMIGEVWTVTKKYPDKLFQLLIKEVSFSANLTPAILLEDFGHFFLQHARSRGYDELFRCQGSTFRDWLRNIDEVHSHLHFAVGKGGMSTFPEFCCEDDDNEEGCGDGQEGGGSDTLILHYKSQRGETYSPFVIGIVKEAAEQYFNLDITFEPYIAAADQEESSTGAETSSPLPEKGGGGGGSSGDVNVETVDSKIVSNKGSEEQPKAPPSASPSRKMKKKRVSGTDLQRFSASWRIRGVTDQVHNRDTSGYTSTNGSPRADLQASKSPLAECPFSVMCNRLSSTGLSDMVKNYENGAQTASMAGDATAGLPATSIEVKKPYEVEVESMINANAADARIYPGAEDKEESNKMGELSTRTDAEGDEGSRPAAVPTGSKEGQNGTGVGTDSSVLPAATSSSPNDEKKKIVTEPTRQRSRSDAGEGGDDSEGLSSREMRKIFPFHIQVDRNFRIRSLGDKLRRYAVQIRPGDTMKTWFKLIAPAACGWEWQEFKYWKDATFELQLTVGPVEDDVADAKSAEKIRRPTALLRLSGGVHMKRQSKNILFLVHPDVESFDDMCKYDLTWSDFPKHSAQKKLVYLAEHLKSETFIGQQSRIEAINAQLLLDMKRTFVRYVSHEIRTPLNTVSMGLKLIQGLRERHVGAPGGQPQILNPVDEGDENVFDMADEIKESCDIAINILNDLLLYEKMEGGLLVLEKKPEPALDLVYEAVKVFSIQAREASVDFDCTYDCDAFTENELDEPTVFVSVDRSKISQVLRNLVSNAIKFTANTAATPVPDENASASSGRAAAGVMEKANAATRARGDSMSSRGESPRGGQRTVIVNSSLITRILRPESEQEIKASNDTGRTNGGPPMKMLRVEVCDSGPGISAENQARLFDEIIQFDPNKLQGGQGSGLGLFISKGIMDLHGGRIGVSSAGEGKGTCFFIEVPVVDKDASGEQHSETSGSVTPTLHMNSMAVLRSRPGSFLVDGEGHPIGNAALAIQRQRSAAGAFLDEWRDPTRIAVSASMHSDEEGRNGYSISGALSSTMKTPGISPSVSKQTISAAINSIRRAAREKKAAGSNNASFPSSMCSSPSPVSLVASRRGSATGLNLITAAAARDSLDSSRHSSPPASIAGGGGNFVSLMGTSGSKRGGEFVRRSSSNSRGGGRGRLSGMLPSPAVIDGAAAAGAPTQPGFAPGNEVSEFDGKLNILVVDDSIGTRKMIARTLKMKKFCDVPAEACDGAEALALVRSTLDHIHDGAGNVEACRPFDAILMDFVMPVMDGPTATSMIREEGYGGLIIGVTGNVLPDDKEFFIGKGADAVLTKPLDVSQLAILLSLRYRSPLIRDMSSLSGTSMSLSVKNPSHSRLSQPLLAPTAAAQQRYDSRGRILSSEGLDYSMGGASAMSSTEQFQAQLAPVRASDRILPLSNVDEETKTGEGEQFVFSNSSSLSASEMKAAAFSNSTVDRTEQLDSAAPGLSGELQSSSLKADPARLQKSSSGSAVAAAAAFPAAYKRGNSSEFKAPKKLDDYDNNTYKSPYSFSKDAYPVKASAAGGNSAKGFEKHSKRRGAGGAILEDIEEEALTPYRKGSSNQSSNLSNLQSPSRSTQGSSIVERVVAGVIRGRVRRLHRSSRFMTSTGIDNSGMLATDIEQEREEEEEKESAAVRTRDHNNGIGGSPTGAFHASHQTQGQGQAQGARGGGGYMSPLPEDMVVTGVTGTPAGAPGVGDGPRPAPPRLSDASIRRTNHGSCFGSIRRVLLRLLCVDIGGEENNPNGASSMRDFRDAEPTNSNDSRVHPDQQAVIHHLIVNAAHHNLGAAALTAPASSINPPNVSCIHAQQDMETVLNENEHLRRASGTAIAGVSSFRFNDRGMFRAASGTVLRGSRSSRFNDQELIRMASTSVLPGMPNFVAHHGTEAVTVTGTVGTGPGTGPGTGTTSAIGIGIGTNGRPVELSRSVSRKNGVVLRRHSSRPFM